MNKYCFYYFWNTLSNELEYIYVNVLYNGTFTQSKINEYAESLFQENMLKLGYSQKEIEKADYKLAIVKGWCGE